MKKILAILLILVMTLAFVACGDDNGETGEPQLPGVSSGNDGDGSGVDTDPIPIPPESLIDIENANKK